MDTYSVPLSQPITDEEDITPIPIPGRPGFPVPDPPPDPPIPPSPPRPGPFLEREPLRPIDPNLVGRICVLDLPDGCYRLTYKRTADLGDFRGTLRVDRAEGTLVVSGDLYHFPPVATTDTADGAQAVGPSDLLGPLTRFPRDPVIAPLRQFNIPIYARSRYHSYLKGVGARLVSWRRIGAPCSGSLTFEQYDYTPPPAGQFNGTFPASPGNRTVTLNLTAKPAPDARWPGRYYEGDWVVGGVSRGTVTLGWVSPSFRRCTVEIDTLVDAVSPQPVPGAGGDESFQTMLASAGWAASVVYDQVAVPKPAGVTNHRDCWSDANLHALMTSIRKASTNLDTEWRMHVLVVPGKMGCSRGKMYDSIGTPREGVVSYSDDGYPTTDSACFGAAAGRKQRDVPRAFLRSASHEVVHGFNQIHQESEGGADNSIMTTTPSVADVLCSAGPGGTKGFPDMIDLRVNQRVRHHLVHFPDPVVRPGGHTFASWATGAGVPQADVDAAEAGLLSIDVSAEHDRIELGEPLLVSWTLTNTSDVSLNVPSDVRTEALFTRIAVIDAFGRRRDVPTFVIECESARIAELKAGKNVSASTRVFWSTNGFAFERPGRYTVEVRVSWDIAGVRYAVAGELPVYVNYPLTDADNAAAAELLHPEVGTWVALGGGATHLGEAVSRLSKVAGTGKKRGGRAAAAAGQANALRGYAGLLP